MFLLFFGDVWHEKYYTDNFDGTFLCVLRYYRYYNGYYSSNTYSFFAKEDDVLLSAYIMGFFAVAEFIVLGYFLIIISLGLPWIFSRTLSPIVDWLSLNIISLLLDCLTTLTLDPLLETASSRPSPWLSLQLISVICFSYGKWTIELDVSMPEVGIPESWMVS